MAAQDGAGESAAANGEALDERKRIVEGGVLAPGVPGSGGRASARC